MNTSQAAAARTDDRADATVTLVFKDALADAGEDTVHSVDCMLGQSTREQRIAARRAELASMDSFHARIVYLEATLQSTLPPIGITQAELIELTLDIEFPNR